MAHITKISSLTEDLISVITGLSIKDSSNKFTAYHELTSRILRSNNYARTNQFDVNAQLEGLEEKFRIYNKDDTADALRKRVDELAKRSQRWTPEILHLLLELSDKPAAKTELRSLDFLEANEELSQPCYRWEDLVAEDPLLRDKSVWQNIDYGAESSEDDLLVVNSDLEASGYTESTTISSNYHESLCRAENDLTIGANLARLKNLKAAQFWRECHVDGRIYIKNDYNRLSVIFITELQAIRESLFMLSGLSTSLFIIHQRGDHYGSEENNSPHLNNSKCSQSTGEKHTVKKLIKPAPGYTLKNVSSQVFYGLMTEIAQYGSSVLVIRAWMRTKQSVPLLQSLKAALMIRVGRFDHMISKMQSSYVDSDQNLIISLAESHQNVKTAVRPLIQISKIIEILDYEPYAHTFRFLELLYDATCASQMAGDEEMYEYLGTMFFDCFQVYLRQIRRWMEEGELWENDLIFFVSRNIRDSEMASLWVDRYKLRKTSNGMSHAPKFLHPVTSKIFTTGKSVVVLKILQKYNRGSWVLSTRESKLDFRTVCSSPSTTLAPFSELFDVAFGQWVKSKHHLASSTLRKTLFDECGLRDSLIALEYVYFMANGATSSLFADALFEKLDSGRGNWNDRFTITELIQRTIGSLPDVTAEKLKVSVSTKVQVDADTPRESVRSLSTITIAYSLPWPVQIIISKDSILSYQKIFNFLLQIRRSTFVLLQIRLVQVKRRTSENVFYGTRSRLLWFTSTLYGYLTDIVIEPNTNNMRKTLGEVDDVDQMIETHQRYMKTLIDQALLGPKLGPIHKTIITILNLAVQLVDAFTGRASVQDEGEITHVERLITERFAASMRKISLHESLPVNPQVRQRRLKGKMDIDSSDGDDADIKIKSSGSLFTDVSLSHIERISKIRSQFDNLCKFVVSGLRGVARAGGEPNWDILADKLEAGLRFAP